MSLTQEEIQYRNDAIDKCGCLCHESCVMHITSCCEFTYQRKITVEANENELDE